MNLLNIDDIAKLKKDLVEYEWKRTTKGWDKDDMEDALKKLRKKRREIEEGLQETSDTISRWLDRIPAKSKFRVTYYENAKSKFLNPQSSEALEHTRESERTAEKKLKKLEEEIEALDEKIRKTKEKIRQLSK